MSHKSTFIAVFAALVLLCSAYGADRAFFVTMGPQLLINTESTTKSAPSPLLFTIGAGMKIPDSSQISFEPAITFFSTYYLWDGNNALPAEIENRTASVFAFMCDVPVVYTWKTSKQHQFEIGGGLAILARFAILAGNVSASDTGTSGSASDDVSEINSWFWQNARYLYPEITGSWLYTVSSRLQVGFTPRIYIPFGSLTNGRGLDGMIVQRGAKALFR